MFTCKGNLKGAQSIVKVLAEKPHSMFMFSSCERSYLYIVLVPSRCVLNEDNGKCNCEPCENLIEARGPGFVLKYGFKKRT